MIFKSINDTTYLVYSNVKSIISYKIEDNKKQNEIKNAHEKYISSFRYYYDCINEQDLFQYMEKIII